MGRLAVRAATVIAPDAWVAAASSRYRREAPQPRVPSSPERPMTLLSTLGSRFLNLVVLFLFALAASSALA